jgi:glycosyltransferase involved in cell wall biosynthesis
MKIAIVCYPTFGGSGVVATELGLELARQGHEVHFITYSQPVRLALLNPNVHYHEVNVPEYPLFQYQPYELACPANWWIWSSFINRNTTCALCYSSRLCRIYG